MGRFFLPVVLPLLSLASAQDNPISTTCHTGVMIIAAVGSGVANGTYSFGLSWSIVNKILNAIPDSDSISINYNRFPTNSSTAAAQFVPEVQEGMPAVQTAIQTYAAACPNTPIVLHGYSEGAVTMMNVLCGGSTPFLHSTPLAASYAPQIISTIIYGDETWTAGQSYNHYDAAAPSSGAQSCNVSAPHLARVSPGPAGCAPFASQINSFCYQADPNCCAAANASAPNMPGTTWPWHWEYPTDYDSYAANFTVAAYENWIAVRAAASLPTGITALGCFIDSSSRVLPVNIYTNSSNTPGLCAAACRQSGYIYSGTEYGDECYCGNVRPTTNTSLSDCSMSCSGLSTSKCGAGWRLSVAQDTSNNATVSTTLASNYAELGCYVDSWARVWSTTLWTSTNTTVQNCATACSAAGYIFSGTENANECHCGNTQPTEFDSASACNAPCDGNVDELCGAGFRLSVVQDKTKAAIYTPPSGMVPYGCYTDNNARALPDLLWIDWSQNNTKCSLGCRAAGYQFSGTEYGAECWCGNTAPTVVQDPANCMMPCSGDSTQPCGGSWGLTVYQDTTWNGNTIVKRSPTSRLNYARRSLASKVRKLFL